MPKPSLLGEHQYENISTAIATVKELNQFKVDQSHMVNALSKIRGEGRLQKILDGKLDEIKREYQTNTFEVGLVTNRKSEIEKEIKNNFQTSKPTFKGLGDNLRLNILLKESQTSDELLNFLVKKAKIQHFKEVIPSANDIFIKSVKEN